MAFRRRVNFSGSLIMDFEFPLATNYDKEDGEEIIRETLKSTIKDLFPMVEGIDELKVKILGRIFK